VRCGLTPHLYRVTRDCDPDWEDVEALLAARRPALAVLIHTFGVPRDVERFCALCHAHGTRVVEDMAHLLPRPHPVLGRTGDFVLWSLPKVLGVPDGAPLWLRDAAVDPARLETPSHPLHRRYLALQVTDLALTSLSGGPLGPLARPARRLLRRLADPYETLMRCFEGPSAMSRLTERLLAAADLDEIARLRLARAEIYEKSLDREVFARFAGDHLPFSSGFGFPVRVADRADLHATLLRHGARGMTLEARWRFVPEAEHARHAVALEVLAQHYVLPTSPHLREDDVRRVVEIANAWAAGRRGRVA
jgi:dTDP-4-amino-4,6-dideoxygalactose transaminase